MTTQAALIMDTIMGMKRVLAQEDDASESDDPYLQAPNRANKLKRKARHLPNEQSSNKRGRTSYTRTIEHAGYKRDILRFNPIRYDEDGDELDSGEEDEEADARAAEENPYAGIKLESLLAPLTSAASLPDHPSLSVPYLSSTLSDMAQHACESLQRERKTLENAKLLLLKLRGDKTWIPTEQLNTSYDDEIFGTSHLFHTIVASSSDDWTQTTVNAEPLNNVHQNVPIPSIAEAELGNVNGVAPPPESGDELREEVADLKKSTSVGETTKALATPSPHPAAKATVNGAGLEENGLSGGVQTNGETIGHENNHNGEEATSAESFKKSNLQKPVTEEPVVNEELPSLDQNYDSKDTNEAAPDGAHDANGENAGQDGPDSKLNGSDEMEDNEDEHSAPRRMRTRAQAHAASEAADSSRSPSVEAVYIPPPVHPIFLIPPSAKPDENYGLSAPEAEETRRMLMIYVQKQEEVVRNAEQLYKNLLKADRLRLTVLKWCKAEGHVGEMSDGEDWYDKEEWGLEDDLRKGEADERLADDDVGVQGKKTRGRRA